MQPDLNRLIVGVDLAAGPPFRTVLPVLLIVTVAAIVLHLLAVGREVGGNRFARRGMGGRSWSIWPP